MSADLLQSLKGGDLRSLGRVADIILSVRDQQSFDELFAGLSAEDRVVAMRAADAVEKITSTRPEFLQPHKPELLRALHNAAGKEIKWHLAQLMPRLQLGNAEARKACMQLRTWALDTAESRIVRVNALQALHDIARARPALLPEFEQALRQLEPKPPPSLRARIRKLMA